MGKNKNRLKGVAGHPQSLLSGKSSVAAVKESRFLKFCFKHYHKQADQSFEGWEEERLLAALMERFLAFSGRTLPNLYCHSFKPYKCFPVHSDFKHPAHVPEDAKWASMHLHGRPCIAGHMVEETFYIVFLDKDHRFYPTELKHT